jgi:spermidine/putrescine transport system permease protein
MATEAPPKVAEIIAGELKPSRARRVDQGRSWALGIWSALALLYLFIPIFVIVVFSFNDPQGRFNFTWQGFTLDHWKDPFANPDLAVALKNSILIAIIATVIATALGTFMAMSLVRYRFRGRGTVDFYVFLPLATPEVVLGAALLALFLQAGTNTGFATIVIAHVMFTISYVVVTVKARLEGMDRHIEEAAMDLGATEWATFRKITLPMIAPGVAAAALLAAAISVDDFVITVFNAGQTQTFPLFIFGATRQGVPPEVNVLATCLLVIILVLMAVNVMVQRRLARRDAARSAAAEAHEQQLAA